MAISAPRQPISLIDFNKTSPVLKMCLTAMLTVLLVIADWSFSFIPFVQLITFLLILYFFTVGYRMTISILAVYVMIDCLVSGGMWPIFIAAPLMFTAWVSLPSLLLLTRLIPCSLYKKLWLVAILAGIHGFIFGQTFAIGNTIIYFAHTDWSTFVRGYQMWVLADIPWEVAQCIVGIATSLLLLPTIYGVLSVVLKKYSPEPIRRNNDE